MREYSKLSPKLYDGRFGRSMRQKAQSNLLEGALMQALSPYLTGCRHNNLVGVFRFNPAWITAELGWPIEVAMKALERLSDEGYITLDKGCEVIWIRRQFSLEFVKDRGTPEKPDKVAKAIFKILDSLKESEIVTDFLDFHGNAFPSLLCHCKPLFRPSKAPSKHGTVNSEMEQRAVSSDSPPKSPSPGEGESFCEDGDLGADCSEPEPDDESPENESFNYPKEFLDFWNAYPRKVSKGDALKAWKQNRKARPPTGELIGKIANLKQSADWTKEGGEFVPYPASWLRAHGWDDEERKPRPQGKVKKRPKRPKSW